MVVCYKRLFRPGTFGGQFNADFMPINPGTGGGVLPQTGVESAQRYCRTATTDQRQKELICGHVNCVSQRHDVRPTCLRCVNTYYYVTRTTLRAEVNNK